MLDTDNMILDIELDDSKGGTLVSEEDMAEIIKHKYGHACFQYNGGKIVINPTAEATIQLNIEKGIAIEAAIEKQMRAIAKQNVALVIDAITAANSLQELETAKKLIVN